MLTKNPAFQAGPNHGPCYPQSGMLTFRPLPWQHNKEKQILVLESILYELSLLEAYIELQNNL